MNSSEPPIGGQRMCNSQSCRTAFLARGFKTVMVSWLGCALLSCSLGPSGAQAADAAIQPAGAAAIASMHARRVAASKALDAATERHEKTDLDAADRKALAVQIAALRGLEAIYLQHESLLEEEGHVAALTSHEEKELARLGDFGPGEPKPYSFLLLERLLNQTDDEEERQANLKSDMKAAKQVLAADRDELDSAQQHLRSAASHGPVGNGDPKPLAQQSAEELGVTLAAARLRLAETVIELQSLKLQWSQARQKRLEEETTLVKKDVRFSADDRDRQLEHWTELASTLDDQRTAEAARWREAIEANGDPPPATSLSRSDEAASARDISSALLLLLEQDRESLVSLRKLWKRRYELYHGEATATQPPQWLDDVDETIGELKDWQRTWGQRLSVLSRARVGTASGEKPDSTEAAWEKFRSEAMDRLWNAFHTGELAVRDDQRWLGRFRDELKAKIKDQARPAGIPRWLAATWDYVLLADKQNPVTVGRLLELIFFVLAGLILAWLASWLLGRGPFKRWGWHPGRLAAFRSILFYVLCIVFGFVAFKALQIPVGAFAFLGGAAAIAVGFGSQDIMNNFMSGIILLVEQPIRVGDVIELDGVPGRVVFIGLRSTRMLTEANHELIVPNKSLLDEQVTNLTLSDQFVRRVITIDVDRTRPVAASKRRMQELAFLHPLVIKSPAPMVLLTEVDGYARCGSRSTSGWSITAFSSARWSKARCWSRLRPNFRRWTKTRPRPRRVPTPTRKRPRSRLNAGKEMAPWLPERTLHQRIRRQPQDRTLRLARPRPGLATPTSNCSSDSASSVAPRSNASCAAVRRNKIAGRWLRGGQSCWPCVGQPPAGSHARASNTGAIFWPSFPGPPLPAHKRLLWHAVCIVLWHRERGKGPARLAAALPSSAQGQKGGTRNVVLGWCVLVDRASSRPCWVLAALPGVAVGIAKILFAVFLVLCVVSLLLGGMRRGPSV